MSNDTPLVLVDGVPETEAVWGPLVTALGRREVTVGLGIRRPIADELAAPGAHALNDFWASVPA
jgi:hypothetical protein